MRRHAFILQLLAVAFAAWTGCAEDGAGRKAPAIVFEATTYDFGHVTEGEPVRHDFGFTNRGDLELAIDTVKAGCSCAVTVSPQAAVPPGAHGTIGVAFDSRAQFGPQRLTVTVYSNDPQHRVTTLALTGEVTADVVAQPARLYVGHVRRGEALAQDVTVLASGDATRVETDPTTRFLNVRSTPLADGRHGQKLALTVRSDAALGPFDDSMEVRTTPPNEEMLRIPVTGVIEPDLLVSPNRLDFEDVVAGTSPTLGLLVENGRHAPVNVSDVGWPAELGRAEVQTLRSGFRYRVAVTLSDTLAPGRIDAVLELRTDHPEQGTLRVPVTATVRSGAAVGAASSREGAGGR